MDIFMYEFHGGFMSI